MAGDLTTLQLARRIADAVFVALHPAGAEPTRNVDDTKDPPTQAVINTLFETNSWFCRLNDAEDSETTEERYPLLEQQTLDF